MKDYQEWCKHYAHDPRTKEARAEYDEYCRSLRAIHAALDKKGKRHESDFKPGG